MEEESTVNVEELVVLSKFEGKPEPENEFERLTIHNGVVVSHDEVSEGLVVRPVPDSEIVGKNVGSLTQE